MFRLILCLIFLLLFYGCTSYQNVYVCKGRNAYAYHKARNCRWLQQCTHRIVKMKEEEAAGTYHRVPCKHCYKC